MVVASLRVWLRYSGALAALALWSTFPSISRADSSSDEVVEVAAGRELVLERVRGARPGIWSLSDAQAENAIVRRGKRRDVARLQNFEISKRKDRRGRVAMTKSEVERECARHVARGYRCSANVVVSIADTPNDSYYSLLYGLTKIDATQAWTATTGDASVIVAVVDTGVNYEHLDLASNIAVNEDEIADNHIDDDGNGYIDDVYGYNAITGTGEGSEAGDPMDDNGHGTHVSGTIAAVGNNGLGVIGVAYGSKVLPVKALSASGSGTVSDIADGIDYAVARGAKVINLSLTSTSDVSTLRTAIENARSSGVLVVAAAGNYTRNIDSTPYYPAAYDYTNLISVAATDDNDEIAYFSNYGPTRVHVAAPGENIASTSFDGGYEYMSGTSMATPHVAGVAALVFSANPELSASDVKDILINTTDALDSLEGKILSEGRVNANRAVAEALVPGNGTSDQVAISIASRKFSSITNQVTGRAYRATSLEGVANSEASLVCNGRARGEDTTESDGSYSFKIKRPKAGKRALRCLVSVNGVESSVVRVKPRI